MKVLLVFEEQQAAEQPQTQVIEINYQKNKDSIDKAH